MTVVHGTGTSFGLSEKSSAWLRPTPEASPIAVLTAPLHDVADGRFDALPNWRPADAANFYAALKRRAMAHGGAGEDPGHRLICFNPGNQSSGTGYPRQATVPGKQSALRPSGFRRKLVMTKIGESTG